ncbi:gustatory receptor 46 [Danaus plexippus plexippus]|uniref:Gustatory receptor 46 n=1 Tax=Danaus plexippus plexippus TaxID=278856 RepID=A0A212F7Z4_DANPL|nr:gustatory receptor 46 [Danaus plexippus plexippus]
MFANTAILLRNYLPNGASQKMSEPLQLSLSDRKIIKWIDFMLLTLLTAVDLFMIIVICIRCEAFSSEIKDIKRLCTTILSLHYEGPLRDKARKMIKLIDEKPHHISIYDMWNMDASTMLNMINVDAYKRNKAKNNNCSNPSGAKFRRPCIYSNLLKFLDQLYEIRSSQNDDDESALRHEQYCDFHKPDSPKKTKKTPKYEDPQDKLYEALTAKFQIV